MDARTLRAASSRSTLVGNDRFAQRLAINRDPVRHRTDPVRTGNRPMDSARFDTHTVACLQDQILPARAIERHRSAEYVKKFLAVMIMPGDFGTSSKDQIANHKLMARRGSDFSTEYEVGPARGLIGCNTLGAA